MQTINVQPTAAATPMSREDNKNLVETLVRSKIFRDYERAFSNATGMPMSFRPVESWQLSNHGKRNENNLCSLLAEKSRSCAACLQVQQQLSERRVHRLLSAKQPPGTPVQPAGAGLSRAVHFGD